MVVKAVPDAISYLATPRTVTPRHTAAPARDRTFIAPCMGHIDLDDSLTDGFQEMRVRLADRHDIDRLLELMRELARFEDYIDEFAVTRESILQHGFGDARLFTALVAEQDDDLVGMAVTYPILWTYTLRPKVVLKELFVVESARHMGTGKALMAAVISHAKSMGAAELIWTVMTGNRAAEGFYRSLGASQDHKWNNWALDLDELK